MVAAATAAISATPSTEKATCVVVYTATADKKNMTNYNITTPSNRVISLTAPKNASTILFDVYFAPATNQIAVSICVCDLSMCMTSCCVCVYHIHFVNTFVVHFTLIDT